MPCGQSRHWMIDVIKVAMSCGQSWHGGRYSVLFRMMNQAGLVIRRETHNSRERVVYYAGYSPALKITATSLLSLSSKRLSFLGAWHRLPSRSKSLNHPKIVLLKSILLHSMNIQRPIKYSIYIQQSPNPFTTIITLLTNLSHNQDSNATLASFN